MFNRKTKPASDAVFIHPNRDSFAYRICELTEIQKAILINVLLHHQSGAAPRVLCLSFRMRKSPTASIQRSLFLRQASTETSGKESSIRMSLVVAGAETSGARVISTIS